MQNRQQQKALTRRAILHAAIETFAEFGFDAASVGQIAERSNTKKALVQYHFETKEKLWQAAVNELWQQRDDVLPRYFKNAIEGTQATEGAENLRFVLRQIIRFAFDHPAWVGIMFREAATQGPRLEWFIETHLRDDYQQGLDFIKHAQQLDLLPEGEALDLLIMISGALFYVIMIAPLTEKITGTDSRSDAFINRYVDSLLAILHCSH